MLTKVLVLLGTLGLATWAAQQPDEPPTFRGHRPERIPGRFVIAVSDSVDPARLASEHGVRPELVFRRAIHGFAGAMSDAAREGLLRDRRVIRAEPDMVMWAQGSEVNAPWGLDRIDQRTLPLSTTYAYTNTGAGVTAYIVDTGIRFDHVDFGGRARSGYDAVDGGAADDCNGHGTHVAGTVGGTTFGVAKLVSLVGVRVMKCDGAGATSLLIAGLDWVAANAHRPAVVNVSIGGPPSTVLDDAVRTLITAGVPVVIAAGNGNDAGVAQDACTMSPARVGAALTISATNKSDKKPTWANYGSCVDWFAPGSGIPSAWYTSNSAAALSTGTSMAAPHVTGVVALYLQTHPAATPRQVHDALLADVTKGVVLNAHTTSNHLLHATQ